MSLKMILTGDINLMGLEEADRFFPLVEPEFKAADVVFGNLETLLYDAPGGGPKNNTAFFARSGPAGEALKRSGIQAVGIANNVNYGEIPIRASLKRLDELGIPHTGAGVNITEARKPVILERNGLKIGFLQRTSVYWTVNHEAKDDITGVAVIRGNTAYQLPLHREIQPMNRPGVAPVIVTWTEPSYLKLFREDLKALRAQCDIVVASFHWGLHDDVLTYMEEIGHAAIDEGADVVIGHGPHDHALPVEVYKGKPIFYGMGALSFYTGHGGRKHGWTGLIAKLAFDGKKLTDAAFQFVRQADDQKVTPQKLADCQVVYAKITKKSAAYGTTLTAKGDDIAVKLGN